MTNFRVASSETARDINRRIVLNLVRQHQPISRASLARRSGMQRSTISAITEQLIAERWVVEGATGHLPRGRKPTFLHLNPDRSGVIGVDIHPRTTLIAAASMEMRIQAQESMPTGREPRDFLERLGVRIRDLMRAHPTGSYEGIGVSLPGRIDPHSQRLSFAPNLNWNDVDIKTPLEKITGLTVELENAANACALAELWSGRHGEGVSHLVVVTISEGIGVGMVMNGQLLRGSQGVTGEFGHVSLVSNGPLCRCGNRGCWEVMASNAAAVRHYADFLSTRQGSVGTKSNMSPVPFTDLLRLVEQGDVKASKALDQMAHYLGVGLAILVTGLAPDVLVVVGDVTRAWNRVGPIVEQAIRQRSFTHAPTRIVPTDPENLPRLRGAIALVVQKHFQMPQMV
ncbi:MAG TPA: ROK family protein [Candidatus Acidoferrales bacterium]|nr:ROK family protein [Candidatus Acidoferrales bacterium]